jgi:hypothetical protein
LTLPVVDCVVLVAHGSNVLYVVLTVNNFGEKILRFSEQCLIFRSKNTYCISFFFNTKI